MLLFTVNKMYTPLAASKWTAFLPRQIQRTAAPLFGMIMLVLCFISNFSSTEVDSFHWQSHHNEKFPRRIWQTWKTNPFGFDERDHTVAKTWAQKNPGHRYEVLTDQNDIYYVESHFGPSGLNRPDVVFTYKSLTAKIIKADLLRYLIMYVEGGVYADIDVEALRPIDRFIPSRFEERDVDMVVGVEIDQPEFKDHPILGPKSMSFCQWTFMCKPRLPVMMQLIDNIIIWINDVAREQQVPISDIKLDFDAVLLGTGPSAFTKAVLDYMSRKTGYPITWDFFHAMDESKLVGGVLVRTVEAFAAGQGHSDSGNHDAKQALVKHHYHASQWPSNHPRYKHPIYEEVERCNWEADCVKRWDENVAAFDSLSPEEQQKQIDAHNLANFNPGGLNIQEGDFRGLPLSPDVSFVSPVIPNFNPSPELV